VSRIYWPPHATVDPRELPELRRGLLDLAAPAGAWERSEQVRSFNEMAGNPMGVGQLPTPESVNDPAFPSGTRIISGPMGYSAEELPDAIRSAQIHADNSMLWYRTHLEEAQLIHVSAELCEVIFASIDSMPESRVLEMDDPPVPQGLVVFQTPFIGIDAGNEFEQVRVDAMLWGPVRLPPWDGWPLSTLAVVPGYGMGAFRYFDPTTQDDLVSQFTRAEALERGISLENQRGWMSLGRSDWLLGQRIDATTHCGIDPEGKAQQSMMEDRKLMAALWALVKQKRIVERKIILPSRESARRLDRQGDQTRRAVEVVHLRRPEYRPRNEDGTLGQRKVGVRYAVRPFWRNQAWGPGWTKHRLILVPGHLRGPEGAPLQHVERIWEVDQ